MGKEGTEERSACRQVLGVESASHMSASSFVLSSSSLVSFSSSFPLYAATMLAPVLLFASMATAKIIHSLPSVPLRWSFVRDAVPSDPISLKIALRQQHADELEQVVLEVSTPGHPNYGMHLTRDQLRSFTAPSATAARAVSAWLQQHGITPSVDNDWVSITTTVDTADALLDTRFSWYQYDKSSKPVLRTLSYSVPDDIAGHVDLVQPTTRFGQLGPRRSSIFDLQYVSDDEAQSLTKAKTAGASVEDSAYGSCSSLGITPACLKAIYNINYTVTEPSQNLVAFASYLEEYARYKDLVSFETNFLPAAKGQSFSVALINNGLNNQDSTDDSGMGQCLTLLLSIPSLFISNISTPLRH